MATLIEEDSRLGDRGIVMVDTEDPICAAASLFSMEDFVVLAMTEQKLFHHLLERLSQFSAGQDRARVRGVPGPPVAGLRPGVCGRAVPAAALFREYVVRYTGPMVKAIQKHGGFARVHCHGRLRAILDDIVAMGADATDPIEPPPQGDVELDYVRQKYGDRLVLFGNIELCDIELMEPAEFRNGSWKRPSRTGRGDRAGALS